MTAKKNDERPGLAIIANCMTPYRAHLHSALVVGIPELKLHTLITHGPAEFNWHLQPPESINAHFFGSTDDSPLAGTFRRPISEWRKGGRLIEYLKQNDVQAVIMMGYRYISYLRTIRYCGAAGLPLFVNNDSNIHGDRRLSASKRWAKKQLYAWWLRRASGVMSMGEYGDQFFTYYGADPAANLPDAVLARFQCVCIGRFGTVGAISPQIPNARRPEILRL